MLRKERKGQVTIFIIMGIVILLIVVGIMFLVSKTKTEELSQTDTTNNMFIKSFIQSCLEETVEEGLIFNGKQGGYYETKEPLVYYYSNVLEVPYYFHNGTADLPELSVWEEELDKYIIDHKEENCNFDVFEKEGYEIISTGNFSSKTQITDYGVILDIKFPLKIKQGETVQEISDFSIKIPSKLKNTHKLIQEIITGKEDEGLLCISCLVDYSNLYNLEFEDTSNIITGTSYITIFDKESVINGEIYLLRFALKDEFVEEETEWWE